VTSPDQIEYAALTDVGVRRSHNQDAHTVLLAPAERWHELGHVFHVADGMGAHAVGEMASAMAVGIIPHTYHKYAQEGIPSAMRKAFAEANASIWEKGQKNPEFHNMGTTSTALVIRSDGAWVGHVGDSRCYRIRNGLIQQLSFDHSLLWEKAKRKGVRPEDIKGVPSNVIVRSLGPEDNVEVDIQGPHPVEEGDVYLLCSDGLSGPLTDGEMGVVCSWLPPAEACQFLIDMANIRGGPDNITVIVVRIGAPNKKKKKGASSAPPAPSRNRRPWYQRIPWPLWILLVGILAAAVAGLFTAYNIPGKEAIFLVAMLTIVGGIAGLFVYQKQEQKRRENEPAEYKPRIKIYRESECQISRKFVDKLVKLEASLITVATERQWDVDWETHKTHGLLFQKHLAEDDLGLAFREAFRAIRPLTEALQRSRHKEESFQPTWETTE